MPVDPEHDAARATAERLLLARVVAERRMAVLRARLAGEEDELLRAHALRVDVDEDRQADSLEVPEAEVGDLDRLSLGRREDDARVFECFRRPLPHSVTGSPLDAAAWSAPSARAWAIASSRARSSSALPRIASLMFSSSRR